MNSAQPRRIFILEGKTQAKPAGYDHVFSFFCNPADSFLHDYFPEARIHALYDEEFLRLVNLLERERAHHPFYYRGVDLLWCFKKALIEFTFYVRYHLETLQQLTACFEEACFYIEEVPEILQYPSLAAMVKEVPSLLKRVRFVAVKPDQAGPQYLKKKGGYKLVCKPSRLSFGKIKKAKVAFFSDFEKCKTVLSYVREMSPVMFCNTIAPRMLFRSVELHFAVWQSEYNPIKHARNYQWEAEEIMAMFSGWRALDGHPFPEAMRSLLSRELERLFKDALPKLLYEIDEMHNFFSVASSLERILVDEDASPAKSAFCQIARKYGIPSVVECHGAMSRKNGLLPLSAEKIFVWGMAQKGKLVSWGCPPGNIIVTGCSRYAPYQKMDAVLVRKRVSKQLHLCTEKPMFLFAPPTLTINRGRWFLEEKIFRNIQLTLSAFEVFLGECSDAQLVLKIHAGDENAMLYKNWAKKNQDLAAIRVIEKFDPLLLGKAVDFLIVYSSTYAVEGFALEKPVLYLFAEDDQMITEMREFGVFLYPRNMEELNEMMHKLLERKWSRPPRWQEARVACLNETSVEPAAIIASILTERGANRDGSGYV